MTDTLSWHLIRDRGSWADDVDTQHRSGLDDIKVTDPRRHFATWGDATFAEVQSVGMVEDLPIGLVDVYVDRAMSHAYTREIEAGTWFSTVAGLDGAWGDGDTVQEAESELREGLVGWIAVKRRMGQDIPPLDGLDLNLRRAESA